MLFILKHFSPQSIIVGKKYIGLKALRSSLFLRFIVLWTKFGIFLFIVYLAKTQDYSSSPHSKTVSTAECL